MTNTKTRQGGSLIVLIPIITTVLDSAILYGFQKHVLGGLSKELVVWLRLVTDNDMAPREALPEHLEEYHRALVAGTKSETRQGFFSNSYRILDSTFALGGSFGALMANSFATKFGRKGGLLMSAFMNFFGALFSGYSKYYDLPMFLFIGRLVLGFKCGVNSVLGPIYIGELVPLSSRPKYLILYSVGISLGALMANLLRFTDNTRFWPLIISSSVIPAIIVLVVLPMCPESPKFLYIVKGQEIECRKALRWLRRSIHVDEELNQIRKEFYQYQGLGDINLKVLLQFKILKHALIIVIFLMVSQELSGISVVLMFYTYFYKKKKTYFKVATYASLMATAVISALISELFSRRQILKWTFTLMGISCALMSITLSMEMSKDEISRSNHFKQLYSHVPAIMHLTSYKFGIGSLIWLMPFEYFSCRTIHYAYSLGASVLWSVKFIVTIFYMPVQDYLGNIGFLNYALVNIGCAYFVHCFVLDTRGKTVKEVYGEIYQQMKLKGEMI